MEAYQKKTADVLESVNSSQKGLSNKEAKARLEKYGYNEIEDKEKFRHGSFSWRPLKIQWLLFC